MSRSTSCSTHAEVRAADEAGFDAFFLPEFHQTRAGGVISPLLTGAALAEGTRRIRVGQAVVPGPLYHPVRLAEDVAMLSWLTPGRALLGVGVGHLPADFELYDVERGSRFGRVRDLLDVIDAAWSGEPFDVSGQHGRWRGHVTPAPFDNKRPEVVMGAHGPRGLELAGQRADLWLSDPQRHVDVVARLAGRVRSAALAAGRQVRIGMFRDAWIGDSRADCEKVWLPHALAVHRLYFNVGVYLAEFEPWVGQVRSRADFTPDLVAPGRFLYGDGQDLRGGDRRLARADRGGVPGAADAAAEASEDFPEDLARRIAKAGFGSSELVRAVTMMGEGWRQVTSSLNAERATTSGRAWGSPGRSERVGP